MKEHKCRGSVIWALYHYGVLGMAPAGSSQLSAEGSPHLEIAPTCTAAALSPLTGMFQLQCMQLPPQHPAWAAWERSPRLFAVLGREEVLHWYFSTLLNLMRVVKSQDFPS